MEVAVIFFYGERLLVATVPIAEIRQRYLVRAPTKTLAGGPGRRDRLQLSLPRQLRLLIECRANFLPLCVRARVFMDRHAHFLSSPSLQ